MSTRPTPERHGGRLPEPDLTPEEEDARMQRHYARGLARPPEEAGGFPEELFEPGPPCPGVSQAVIEDRRGR